MLRHNYAADEQAEALNRENGSQGFQQGRIALTQQKGKRKEENAKVQSVASPMNCWRPVSTRLCDMGPHLR